jgi:hypothetical protein
MKRYTEEIAADLEDADQQQQQHQEDIIRLSQKLNHSNESRPLVSSRARESTTAAIIKPSVNDFYFPPINPTVQTYYRFKTSQVTPFAALHKRPLDGPFGRMMDTSSSSLNYGSNMNGNYTSPSPQNPLGGSNSSTGVGAQSVSNVTGLLRRSAVLPCHGMLLF